MAIRTLSALSRLLVVMALVILAGDATRVTIWVPLLDKREAEQEARRQEQLKRSQYDLYLETEYRAGKPRAWVELQPYEETPVISIEARSHLWRGWMALSGCVELTVNERFVFEQCEMDEHGGLFGNTSLWSDEPKRTVRFKAKDEPAKVLLFVDQANANILTITDDTPTGRFYVRPGAPARISPNQIYKWKNATLRELTWTLTEGCVHIHTENRSTRSCAGQENRISNLIDNVAGFDWMVAHAYEEEVIMEVKATFRTRH